MHEVSLMAELLRLAHEALACNVATVTAVRLQLGELAGVMPAPCNSPLR